MVTSPKTTAEKAPANIILPGRFVLTGLLALLFVFVASGCRSYKALPNGFIVRGDYDFVSVDEQFTVSIGTDLLNTAIWDRHSPPLRASGPTLGQRRVLKKLGYDRKNYVVVFTSVRDMPFQLVGLVNSHPLASDGKARFMDVGKLDRKGTDYAKWHEETREISGKRVYHAVIPISEQLFAEKYLSIVYTGPPGRNGLELVEVIVRENAEKYRSVGQRYFPMKTVGACPGKEGYFDYTVPEAVRKHNGYTLIKAFSDREKTALVYYSLLQPG